MKAVPKKKTWIIAAVFMVVLLAIAFGILTPEKQSGFWGQLGITRESIKEVQLEFQGQRVGMTETKAASFLDTLTTLGSHMAKVSNNNYYEFGHGRSLEVFAVDEVLKGSFDDAYYRMPSEHTTSGAEMGFEGGYWDQISIAQQSIHNPDYLPGVQYLICVDIIQYEVQVDTDQDSYTYMEQRNQTHGQYDTAVVDGDMLYPRYNTELHPFYNLHLNELKELLQ